MAFINICHRCEKAVEAKFDAMQKAYVCPNCGKQFADTYAIFSNEWEKWPKEKQDEYVKASLSGNKQEFFKKYPVAVNKKSQKKSRLGLILFMLILLVAGVVCLFNPITIFVSVFCFIILIFLTAVMISARKDLGKNYEMSDVIRYDPEAQVLQVFRRDERIKDYVKVTEAHNLSLAHEPEKIHIGAVSVGGVTTGGVYKTGGYDYVKVGSKNGNGMLTYKGNFIKTIQLNDATFKIAKKDIPSWLDDSEKQIKLYTTIIPSMDMCQFILDWLCGK